LRHWEDLERLLSSLYFKELDQEENVWRSLPFFSATLAVEVVVLNQILPLASRMSGGWWWALLGFGTALTALMLGVLVFLYRSIRRRSFSYIASGKDLVEYVMALEAADPTTGASSSVSGDPSPRSAVNQLRATVIGQLAAAADANRVINQSRAAERSRAGILLLASIVTTSIVVGVTIGHEIATEGRQEAAHGVSERPASRAAQGTFPGPERNRPTEQTEPSGATQDAGGKQGLDLPRAPADAGAGGGAKR
jgi:hypothetical protein